MSERQSEDNDKNPENLARALEDIIKSPELERLFHQRPDEFRRLYGLSASQMLAVAIVVAKPIGS